MPERTMVASATAEPSAALPPKTTQLRIRSQRALREEDECADNHGRRRTASLSCRQSRCTRRSGARGPWSGACAGRNWHEAVVRRSSARGERGARGRAYNVHVEGGWRWRVQWSSEASLPCRTTRDSLAASWCDERCGEGFTQTRGNVDEEGEEDDGDGGGELRGLQRRRVNERRNSLVECKFLALSARFPCLSLLVFVAQVR